MRIVVEYFAAALIVVAMLMAALWLLEIAMDVLSPLLDRLIWGGYEAVMTAMEAVGL